MLQLLCTCKITIATTEGQHLLQHNNDFHRYCSKNQVRLWYKSIHFLDKIWLLIHPIATIDDITVITIVSNSDNNLALDYTNNIEPAAKTFHCLLFMQYKLS